MRPGLHKMGISPFLLWHPTHLYVCLRAGICVLAPPRTSLLLLLLGCCSFYLLLIFVQLIETFDVWL